MAKLGAIVEALQWSCAVQAAWNGMNSENLNSFSTSYQQWAQAQALVTDYERAIFKPEHQLTASELSHLQSLRTDAAELLQQLVGELDAHLASLHPTLQGDPFSVAAHAHPAPLQMNAGQP